MTAGRLADNILHFARALRAAGLPVGPSRAVDAARAVAAAGFQDRASFRAALASCLISKPEHRAPFDAAFDLFWRDPQILERFLAELMPEVRAPREERAKKQAERRIQDALTGGSDPPAPPAETPEEEEVEIDARLTFSEEERLRGVDFEQMSAAEIASARAAIAGMRLPVAPIRSRRLAPAPNGRRPDWRATLRASLRNGGDLASLKRRAPTERWPTLVALCDVSGSMDAYSRMLLHFLHAAASQPGRGWSGVEAFVFGTRLTRITRHLKSRDVDEALAAIGGDAQDWRGGTRIGESLRAFNRDWSRRVLGTNAVVLLITDGLDRGDPGELAAEADRLRRSCKRLVWVNPLLRWDGFSAKAQGVRALLPRVDSFRACHNLDSLAALAEALTAPDDDGERTRLIASAAESPAHPSPARA